MIFRDVSNFSETFLEVLPPILEFFLQFDGHLLPFGLWIYFPTFPFFHQFVRTANVISSSNLAFNCSKISNFKNLRKKRTKIGI